MIEIQAEQMANAFRLSDQARAPQKRTWTPQKGGRWDGPPRVVHAARPNTHLHTRARVVTARQCALGFRFTGRLTGRGVCVGRRGGQRWP